MKSDSAESKINFKRRITMFEFKINFKNRTCYGDHYSVWVWVDNRWVSIIDKIYYANTRNEILSEIKNECKSMFGIKRAIWRINYE